MKFLLVLLLAFLGLTSKAELPPQIARLPLFERAVAVVRHFDYDK